MEKITLAEFIKTKREEKNWSMRELAEKAGISHSEIARMEKGERLNPSAATLRVIATALNVPITKLLETVGLVDEMKKPIIAARIKGSDDLTPDEMNEVEKYIDYLKSRRK